MQVEIRDGESFEGLLKRFKAGVMNAGILSDYKRHSVYSSPSEQRRRKLEQARRRARKAARKRA
ncbi:MAG: 30S ribosomal protein S21 [Chloroflexi bacterium]|nr:30S ribosomal protein S21 [Chloroflexota bacterium]